MKTLKTLSEITARNLKSEDCDYKGKRIGFDKSENLYFEGSWFNPGITFYETISELKLMIKSA